MFIKMFDYERGFCYDKKYTNVGFCSSVWLEQTVFCIQSTLGSLLSWNLLLKVHVVERDGDVMPTAPFHHHHLYWHVYLLLLAKISLLLLLAAVVVAIQSNAELQAKKFLDHMDRVIHYRNYGKKYANKLGTKSNNLPHSIFFQVLSD